MTSSQHSVRVGIIGASGYTGLELIKILCNHPYFRISYLGVTSEETTLGQLHPVFASLPIASMPVCVFDHQSIPNMDLVFLATPHKASMAIVKVLRKHQPTLKIIDLSADYRLDLETYQAHYETHRDPDGLQSSIYGLPEFYRDAIKTCHLVANPGCYPTASLLGILPFVEHLEIETPIIIDAKSGLSGAGKKPSDTKHFAFINENILPYNPLSHRHEPEIQAQIKALGGQSPQVHFVPSLIPVTRGMQINAYLHVSKDLDPCTYLKDFYADAPFVRIFDEPIGIKNSAGTNYADIYAKRSKDLIFVSVGIDNLLRGASSQAVVNANLMFGFDEMVGINCIGYMP